MVLDERPREGVRVYAEHVIDVGIVDQLGQGKERGARTAASRAHPQPPR